MTTNSLMVSMPSSPFTSPRALKVPSNGRVYIGAPDTDPVNPANQIPVYIQNEDGSEVQVSQPIIINTGGFLVYNGQISKFVVSQNYSMAVYDSYGVQQYYWPNLSTLDPNAALTESINQVFSTLGSSSGASNVYLGNASLDKIVSSSIFIYMNKDDITTIIGGLGTEVNVDYALMAAISAGVTDLFFPPVKGVYVLGSTQITLPSGFSMSGVSSKPYTAASSASFNNRGTVLRIALGASSIFQLTNRHTFNGILFDGRDKSVNLMKGADQTQYCKFYNCGMYRWLNGVGGSSPSGYTATLQVISCSIASNYRGVRNVIDSRFADTTINANDNNGVELNTGANNNSFIHVRNEWNGAHNYYGYNSKRNIICGELIDRAGYTAVAAVVGAQWILSGVAIQRSGKNAVAGDENDTHFYIEGDSSSIVITGGYTLAGADDDGGGRLSPTYLVATGGNTTDAKEFLASGVRLSGYSGSSWIRSGAIARMAVLGCPGVQDTVNTGFLQVRNGKHHLGDSIRNVSLSGAGSTVTMTFQATDSDLPQYSIGFSRAIEIISRNNTATGSASRYFIKLLIIRESVSAAIYPDRTTEESQVTLSGGTWGVPASNPTGVSVAFSISSDAKTLTVTLTAIDSASRLINAELLA